MKKFIKCCFSLVLAVTVIFSFTACKTKISKTTTNVSKVAVVNGVSTNGGMTVVRGDWLYFINGTQTPSAKNLEGNKQSAICRVKYDASTGKVNSKTYEVVVSNLVGFDDGSINFFGDFMYFTTPCEEKNYKGDVLFNKTKFMRYDLVNKKSYEIYTTVKNSSDETISYAYYVVGDDLHLVVYEKSNATITSIKIGDEPKTNYVIKDVVSCVLSENYGASVTEGKDIDANSFVYYTVSPVVDLEDSVVELPQDGVRVFRTSPAKNNSKLIANNGEDVTLLCVRAGKLLTNIGNIVYAHEITGANNETLAFNFSNVISYQTYENVIFLENSDGSISVLSYNKDTYEVVVTKWFDGVTLEHNTVSVLDKSDAFEFVTTITVDEIVVEDDEETDEDETKKEKVQSLIYIDDKSVYKLEIARENSSGEMVQSRHSQPIKLTITDINSSSGMLVPEVIGNYLFIYATNKDDSKIYMYQADVTITENAEKSATFIGIKK